MDWLDIGMYAAVAVGLALLGVRRLLADRRASVDGSGGSPRIGGQYFLFLALGLALLIAITEVNYWTEWPLPLAGISFILVPLGVSIGSHWKLRKALLPR